MASTPQPIACSIENLAARERGVRLLQAQGATCAPVPYMFLGHSPPGPAVLGLVYDLAPWNGSASDQLAEFRTRYPLNPVFLYYPAGLHTAELAAAAQQLPHVWGIRHLSAYQEDLELARHFRRLLQLVPTVRFKWLVREILRHAPVQVTRYVGVLLGALDTDTVRLPHVSDAARAVGLSPRQLERVCRKAELPTPLQLRSSVTFLHLTFTAYWTGDALAKTAERWGIPSAALHRLRHKALPPADRLAAASPAEQFTAGVSVLAMRCRRAAEDAAALITHVIPDAA